MTFTLKTIFVLIISFCLSMISFPASKQKTKKHQPNKIETSPKVTANYGKYEFTFKSLDGKIIRLSDYSGKVVLVNIWAPWCPPCKKESPGFVKLYEQYRKKGFEILGVAVQTNESSVRTFMSEYKVQWQVGIKDEIAKMYGTYGIPDSYLFRPDGSLLKEFVGYASEEALEPFIKEALKLSK